MLKATIKRITMSEVETSYGEEAGIREALRREFPEARPFFGLRDIVKAINENGQVEVEVQPFQPSRETNRLPPDYLTHEESEDPWPRKW